MFSKSSSTTAPTTPQKLPDKSFQLPSEDRVMQNFERELIRDLPETTSIFYFGQNDKFLLKNHNMNLVQLIQYATIYYLRLSILKPQVILAARSKWKDPDLVYFKDILEVITDTKTVVVGTLYKDMSKKPCILKHLDGVLGSRKARNYCSAADTIILEDASGRIRIRGFDGFQ